MSAESRRQSLAARSHIALRNNHFTRRAARRLEVCPTCCPTVQCSKSGGRPPNEWCAPATRDTRRREANGSPLRAISSRENAENSLHLLTRGDLEASISRVDCSSLEDHSRQCSNVRVFFCRKNFQSVNYGRPFVTWFAFFAISTKSLRAFIPFDNVSPGSTSLPVGSLIYHVRPNISLPFLLRMTLPAAIRYLASRAELFKVATRASDRI